MPKISIIIPIYNAEKYLSICLNSISQQTYNDFEVLLINDGSNDGSSLICHNHQEADSRFIHIYKENGGVSSARNLGLDKAKGEYVCFIDADDWIEKNYIEILMSSFVDTAIDMSLCSYISDFSKVPAAKDTMFFFSRTEIANILFLDNRLGYQGFVWNKMFRRKIIKENGIRFNENASYNEDRLFCIEYVCNMKGKVLYTSKALYHYCKHEGSLMNSADNVFNEALFSDFETSIEILQMLRKLKFPRRTINLARDRIYNSYDVVRRKMRRLHYEKMVEKKIELRNRAIEISGGYLFFIDNRIRKFLTKQINHFVRNEIYLEKL